MKKISLVFMLILLSVNLSFAQKTFEIKKFGFSMQEPEGWIETDSISLKENLENFEFDDEKKFAEMLKTSNKAILLKTYHKYNLDEKEGLIPKIQIDVLPNPTKDYNHFKSSITSSAGGLKKYFDDYEFIKEPTEVTISGIKSVMHINKFSIKMQDGQILKVRARVYAIPYKTYFFQVNMVDGQTEEDNSAVFDKLVNTIKIGK